MTRTQAIMRPKLGFLALVTTNPSKEARYLVELEVETTLYFSLAIN